MLIRWISVLLILGLAVGANAALLLREPSRPSAPLGDVAVSLDGLELKIPRALIRDPSQQAGGRLPRVDLIAMRAGLEPRPPSLRPGKAEQSADHVVLILTNAGMRSSPADQLQQLFARFLLPETVKSDSGLVMRHFRPGSPYEDKELFIGAGQFGGNSGRLFIALCPRPGAKDVERCTARLRHEKIEVELRFKPLALEEWRQLGTQTLALLERLRAEPAN
ncbi:hypothetical protein MCEMSEM23_00640 [Rhabdaerophilaceae bacterium]